MHMRRVLSATAWALLTFITFATLSPYSMRPELTETEPNFIVLIERVGAFGMLGLIFLVSYPERLRTVCLIVFGGAVALELGQAILPDRHAGFTDVLEKIVGGGAGILLGVALPPALIGSKGLFSRIDQQRLGPSMMTIDSERRELLVGSLIIALFALALVLFQTLGA